MQGEDFYSVDEATRILKLTSGRIRQVLRSGELEGVPPGEAESGGRGWKIPMHAIHDRNRPARVEHPPGPLAILSMAACVTMFGVAAVSGCGVRMGMEKIEDAKDAKKQVEKQRQKIEKKLQEGQED